VVATVYQHGGMTRAVRKKREAAKKKDAERRDKLSILPGRTLDKGKVRENLP